MFSIDTPENILDYEEAEVLHLAKQFNHSRTNMKAKAKLLKLVTRALGYTATPDTFLALLAEPEHKLLLAGAGAGKTSAIHQNAIMIKIIHHLVTKKTLSPYNMLMLSFSDASVMDIESRHYQMVSKVINSGIINSKNISTGVTCKTIHAFGNMWANAYLSWLGYTKGEAVLVRDDKVFVDRLEATANMLRKKFTIPEFDPERMLEVFRMSQEMLIPPDSEEIRDIYPECPMDLEIFKLLFERFQASKKLRGIYDYTDMLSGLKHLIESHPDFLNRMALNYNYIFIDEAQDLNPIMIEIARLLSKKIRVTLIADDDQTIYGFRGARAKYLRAFKQNFSNSGVFSLTFNRRCAQLICDAALDIVSLNEDRFDKVVKPINSGGEIFFEGYVEEDEQIDNLIRILKEKDYKDLMDTSITVRDNIATAYITNRLFNEGMDYTLFNGQHALSHPIYKIMHNMLQLICYPYDPNHKMNLNQITPARKKQLEEVFNDSSGNFDNFKASHHFLEIDYGALENVKDFRRVLDLLGTMNQVSKTHSISEYIDNLFGLVKKFHWDYQMKQRSGKSARTLAYHKYFTQEAYNYFNRDLAAIEMLDKYNTDLTAIKRTSEANLGVKVGNMHSHKGLEFKEFHILYMDSEIFPIISNASNLSEEAIDNEYQSENSLCYVAYTRAAETLYLHYNLNRPSPYVLRTKEFLSTYKPEPIFIPYIDIMNMDIPDPTPFKEKDKKVEVEKKSDPLTRVSSQLFEDSKKSIATASSKAFQQPMEDFPTPSLDYEKLKQETDKENESTGLVSPSNPNVSPVKPKTSNGFLARFNTKKE